MKTVFIKSGGYYETPGVSIIGAINDIYGVEVRQFNKLEAAFRLDLVNLEYRIYSPFGTNSAESWYKVDVNALTQAADRYGVAYLGVVGQEDAAVSPRDVLRDLKMVVIDPVTKKLMDSQNQEILTGNNVTPLAFFVKMANDTYAMVLSKLMVTTSRVDDYRKPAPPGLVSTMRVVTANDGESVRDKFLDVKFNGVLKHFRNHDLVTGYAVFAKMGCKVTLDLFKDAPFVTEEFKQNFQIDLDTSLDGLTFTPEGKIEFVAPKERTSAYLCVKLVSTPLYEDIASREIKEVLSFDFTVNVI